MSESPRARRRRQVVENWRLVQNVLFAGMVMPLVMPFLWGWPELVAKGEMTWLHIAKIAAAFWAFSAFGGEIIRRKCNWEIGEPACKWVWQK